MNIQKLIILLISLSCPLFAQINFTGNIDKTRLSVDDQLVITLEATGKEVAQGMPEPEVPKLEGLRLVDKKASMTSTSSFRIIINGKDMSQGGEKKITWQYILAPTDVGQFAVPSFVLNYKGKTYNTQPVTIEIIKEKTQNQDVIFECLPQKTSVYLGEQFRCIVRIAFRADANAFNPQRPNVEETLRKSFWIEPLEKGEIKGRREIVNGAAYNVFDIPFALYPVQTGKITIPSFVLQYEQQQQTQRQRSVFEDPFFDGFFGGGARSVPKQKMSRPVTVMVKDLPPAPQNFSGSVGAFSLSAECDRSSLPVGDAITYTLTLKGNSSLQSMKDPMVPQISGFETFEPEKKSSTGISNGVIQGIRQYKYVMIPQREGSFNLPPAKYVYFDPVAGAYRTVETRSFQITATPGKRMAPVVSSGGQGLFSRQEIKQLGSDIRFIKTGDAAIVSASKPLHRNSLFILLQFVPALLLAGSFLYKRQRRRLTEDVGYARLARSKKQVRKRLADARSHLKDNKPAEYYGALSNGIVDYIGDIMNVEARGMTLEALRSLLSENGQETGLVNGIIGLLEKADFARFATSSITAQDVKEDLDKTENLLNKLERRGKK